MSNADLQLDYSSRHDRLSDTIATSTLLRAIAAMPALTRLSLSLCVAPPPPPGMTVRCCAIGGGLEGFRGPLLTALDLWQVSFPDKGDDGRALKVRVSVTLLPPFYSLSCL